MPSDLYSTLVATAEAHRLAYCSPQPWCAEEIWKVRTPDCIHHLHPSQSLPEPFNGPITPDMHRNFMAFFGPAFSHCDFRVEDTMVDTEKKMVFQRILATFDFKEIPAGPGREAQEAVRGWQTDYFWLCFMTDDGKLVREFRESMDVQKLMGFARERAEMWKEYAESEQKQ